jgi:hypothetical protein
LLSACAGAVDVRPVDAVNMLGNAQSADLKLGAAVLQEVKILGFLGNRDAAGRYEAMLAFITGRGNAARAEIEAFYRQNVGALIAAEVDAQFNRVGFMVDRKYDVVLTRDAKNQYVLSYERPSVENDDKTLTAPTLEALLAEMRKNTADFSQASIDTVRAQAALMPAVSNVGVSRSVTALLSEILTGFYTATTSAERERYYKAIEGLYVLYLVFIRGGRGDSASPALYALSYTLAALNPEFSRRVSTDVQKVNAADVVPGKLPSGNEIDALVNLASQKR